MQNAGVRPSRYDLSQHGLRNFETAYWNLGTAQLIEKSLQRHEGLLASGGAFVVRAVNHTPYDPAHVSAPRQTTMEQLWQEYLDSRGRNP